MPWSNNVASPSIFTPVLLLGIILPDVDHPLRGLYGAYGVQYSCIEGFYLFLVLMNDESRMMEDGSCGHHQDHTRTRIGLNHGNQPGEAFWIRHFFLGWQWHMFARGAVFEGYIWHWT
jgi:hypothetical protein